MTAKATRLLWRSNSAKSVAENKKRIYYAFAHERTSTLRAMLTEARANGHAGLEAMVLRCLVHLKVRLSAEDKRAWAKVKARA